MDHFVVVIANSRLSLLPTVQLRADFAIFKVCVLAPCRYTIIQLQLNNQLYYVYGLC